MDGYGLTRTFRFLAAEFGQGAAGQAAGALLLASAACSLIAMTRAFDPAGGITLAVACEAMAIALTVASVRRAAIGRTFERGRLPLLPANTRVLIRNAPTPVVLQIVVLAFSYGFFGLWLTVAWKVAREHPESPHAGLAPIASALMLASTWYLMRSNRLERAAVRAAAIEPEALVHEVVAILDEATAHGTRPERFSPGALLGGLFLLVSYLALALDPKCVAVTVKVMGERPLGVPWPIALAGLILVLGAPLVPLTHHALEVMRHAMQNDGTAPIRPLGFFSYLFRRYDAPGVREARRAIGAGLVWYTVLMFAWIAYASRYVDGPRAPSSESAAPTRR